MSDEILIAYGDKPSDTAVLLLGAADSLGLEPWVVRNQPEDGGFRVPQEVAEEAGLSKRKANKAADEDEAVELPEQKSTAKKAPAKKTAAKKTASKE